MLTWQTTGMVSPLTGDDASVRAAVEILALVMVVAVVAGTARRLGFSPAAGPGGSRIPRRSRAGCSRLQPRSRCRAARAVAAAAVCRCAAHVAGRRAAPTARRSASWLSVRRLHHRRRRLVAWAADPRRRARRGAGARRHRRATRRRRRHDHRPTRGHATADRLDPRGREPGQRRDRTGARCARRSWRITATVGVWQVARRLRAGGRRRSRRRARRCLRPRPRPPSRATTRCWTRRCRSSRRSWPTSRRRRSTRAASSPSS